MHGHPWIKSLVNIAHGDDANTKNGSLANEQCFKAYCLLCTTKLMTCIPILGVIPERRVGTYF